LHILKRLLECLQTGVLIPLPNMRRYVLPQIAQDSKKNVILCVNEPLNFYTEYSNINKEEKIHLNRESRKLIDMDKNIPS
jgi:hypothetical protein